MIKLYQKGRMTAMTLKQTKFVKEYLTNGGNGTKAALAVYGTKDSHTAHQIAYENLRKPAVIQELRRSLESLGLSDEYLDLCLREIIESGVANKSRTRPADALNAIEMVNRLKDRFPSQKHLVANVNLTAELETQSIPELKKQLEELQESNRKLFLQLES